MSKLNPQKATAYVGPGVLRKGGKITPVPDGHLIKKTGKFKGSTLKNGGPVSDTIYTKKDKIGNIRTNKYVVRLPDGSIEMGKVTKTKTPNGKTTTTKKSTKSSILGNQYTDDEIRKSMQSRKNGGPIRKAQNGDTLTVKKPTWQQMTQAQKSAKRRERWRSPRPRRTPGRARGGDSSRSRRSAPVECPNRRGQHGQQPIVAGGAIPRGPPADAAAATQIPAPGQLLSLGDADAPGLQQRRLPASGWPLQQGRHRRRPGRQPEARGRRGHRAVMAAVDAETACQQARPGGRALRLPRQGRCPQQHPVGPVGTAGDHVDAVVHAVGEIDVEPAGLPEEGVVARRAAAVAVAGRLALAVGLRFHNHAPQQLA